MRIRIKKLHEDAVVPKYAYFGDACVDLVAVRKWTDSYDRVCYGTGIAIEIPEGHVGLLFPRSSISKKALRLANSVGVIDSGYRGEVIAKFDRLGPNQYEVGERVVQLMLISNPSIQFVEVPELRSSDRDVGGFGSSGS